MNRTDFLNALYYYLSPLPNKERNEILEDFREHFREGTAAGKSEEQICEELGSPMECAKQYVGDAVSENTIKQSKMKKINKNSKGFWVGALIWNIIQMLISMPITFGLFSAAAIMCVIFAFIIPAIPSVAFIIFAISSTVAVLSLAMITLLWAVFEIKECIRMINR